MESSAPRTPYPSDVSDEEWAFVAPYLTLMTPNAPQRRYDRREVYTAMRWIVRSGAQWRMLPHEFPPWPTVYQQTQRWIAAGVFETMVHDLRVLLRWLQGRADAPKATILDSRTVQSTPESGHRAGYDGYKRRKGSKVPAAVDTLGELVALHVTPADVQDRAQVGEVAEAVQDATGDHVEVAFVDQGYTGEPAADAAADQGLCAAAPSLGRRTQFRVGEPLPPTGPGLRTLARHGGGTAFCGLCVSDASSIDEPRRPKSITGSRHILVVSSCAHPGTLRVSAVDARYPQKCPGAPRFL